MELGYVETRALEKVDKNLLEIVKLEATYVHVSKYFIRVEVHENFNLEPYIPEELLNSIKYHSRSHKKTYYILTVD